MMHRQLLTTVLLASAFVFVHAASAQAADDEAAQAAPAQWTAAELASGYVVFRHNILESLPAAYVPVREALVDSVSCALARGEYEALQIGVHALADGGLSDVRVRVESDLPVAVYHRINSELKQQVAQSEATWFSWTPAALYLEKGDTVVSLPQGESVNFWFTFYAAPEAAAGMHAGTIEITPAGRPPTVLNLEVQVRPYVLPAARVPFGMYHREDFFPSRFGGFGMADSTALAIYRDMAAHGQNSVTFYGGGDYRTLPPTADRAVHKSIDLAKQAGLVHAGVPCLMLQDNIPVIDAEQRQAAVAWLQGRCRERGWPEIMQYGWDEPPCPAPGLRESYLPMRGLSMRLGTAITMDSAYAYSDVHDAWIVLGGETTPEMQAEARRLGAEVWTYSYRILREGFNPLRQRFYAGLYTWAHRLSGNLVWAYWDRQHGHVWYVPGSDEPLPVTGWETRREGIDDYRYLQTLEAAVAADAGKPVSIEAAAWLEALRVRLLATDPHEAEAGKPLAIDEYDGLRTRAAEYIAQLGGVPPESAVPLAVTRLKDEAAPFRGKSVDACIAGLRADDAPTRRAAAWALFEMGAKAAPAVRALAGLLSDRDVRVPALRALEAIGPAIWPVTAQVAALLQHADAFLRVGATLTLGAIGSVPEVKGVTNRRRHIAGVAPATAGRAAVEPLRVALGDGNPIVARAAGQQLSRFGELAALALPEAIELLDHDDWHYKSAAKKVIAASAARGAAAVPRLVELYDAAKGRAPDEALALAAVGAAEAVPVLAKHAVPDNPYRAHAWYALYCIRGDASDLQNLVSLLEGAETDASRRREALVLLNALGVKAAPAADAVRGLLGTDSAEVLGKEDLEAFLEKVEKGRGPYTLVP